MIANRVSDDEWRIEADRLATAAAGRIIGQSHDRRHFGNRVMEVTFDGHAIRMVRDRGDLRIEISDGLRWHSPDNLYAFASDTSVELAAVIDFRESIDKMLGADWPLLKSALHDPDLAAFEEAIGAQFLHSLGNAADEPHTTVRVA